MGSPCRGDLIVEATSIGSPHPACLERCPVDISANGQRESRNRADLILESWGCAPLIHEGTAVTKQGVAHNAVRGTYSSSRDSSPSYNSEHDPHVLVRHFQD
jgi:hypothetical protein